MIYPNGVVKLIDANSPYGNLTSNKIKGSDLAGSWMVKNQYFLKLACMTKTLSLAKIMS